MKQSIPPCTGRLLMLVVALTLGGCAATGARAPALKKGVLEDEWCAVSMAGARAGYVHTLVRELDGVEPEFVTTVFSETHIQRFGFKMDIRTSVEYRETPEGALRSAVSTSSGAGGDVVSEAEVRGDKMIITTRTGGQSHVKELPWDAEVIGPAAQTRQVRASGMEPGRPIIFKAFLPELQRVAKSVLIVEGPDTITLAGQTRTLRKGKMSQDVLPGMDTLVWLDDDGGVVRSLTQVLGGVETRRVTRAEALRAVAPEALADVMSGFLVRSNVEIAEPAAVAEALYRLRFETGVPELPLADRRQTIVERGANEILLRVAALGDAAQPAVPPPGPECLAPSPYIQSDDQEIARTAAAVTAGAALPAEKARRLQAWVFRNITRKDYNVGFASAKEVFISREGDCTEHSVLLAALLRAVGIPSRVAVGVVYYKGTFAYHMWTEAFLNDWTALDATMNKPVVDATHLRLTATPLDTASAADPFLALVPVIGKMTLRVEEVKTGL